MNAYDISYVANDTYVKSERKVRCDNQGNGGGGGEGIIKNSIQGRGEEVIATALGEVRLLNRVTLQCWSMERSWMVSPPYRLVRQKM